MYVKEASDYEKLYSLDVLGVEDRGEDDHAVALAQYFLGECQKRSRQPVQSERALDSR